MGVFEQDQQRNQASGNPHAWRPGVQSYTDSRNLPGVAGYRSVYPLPKNAMPNVRFKFKRPDGRPD